MGSFRVPRLSAVVAACAAGAVSIVAVAVVVIAIQFTRTIVSVSSDPLRDLDVRVVPSQTPSSGVTGMIARGERINVLLLGYGGAGHDGAFLTDSLMIASIEPQTAAQHAQHELVTERAIIFAHRFAERRQQHRCVRVLQLDSPQDLERGAARGRNCFVGFRKQQTLSYWIGQA